MKYTGLSINEKINNYYTQKKELDKQQKAVLQLGREIKEHLLDNGLSEYDAGKLSVSISEVNKDVLDEDRLMEEVRNEFPQVIKTKEYVDMDELENLVYNRQVSPDFLQQFIIHKEPIIRLNIKQRKENEDGKDNNNPCNTENHPEN